MIERFGKLVDVLVDILQILPRVIEDIYSAVTGLLKAIKAMDIQGIANALVRLIAVGETVLIQLCKAVTDLLDAIRTKE